MSSRAMDVINGLVKQSTLHGPFWEGGFEPFRALVSLSCDGCRQPIPKNGIVWYGPEQPRRCTRCRNTAILIAPVVIDQQGGKTA